MFLDFASNPVLLVAIPLLFAFVAVFLKKIDKALLLAAAVLNVAAAVFLAATFDGLRIIEIGGFAPPFGISLVLDEYSLIGVALLNGIFAAMLLMSSKLVQKHATIFLVSLAALNGMILTGDLFNLFVFMEIAAISAYIFTAMEKGYKHSFNYLVVGTLGSVLFLFGIILLYNIFGSLNMFDIQEKLGEPSGVTEGALALPLVHDVCRAFGGGQAHAVRRLGERRAEKGKCIGRRADRIRLRAGGAAGARQADGYGVHDERRRC